MNRSLLPRAAIGASSALRRGRARAAVVPARPRRARPHGRPVRASHLGAVESRAARAHRERARGPARQPRRSVQRAAAQPRDGRQAAGLRRVDALPRIDAGEAARARDHSHGAPLEVGIRVASARPRGGADGARRRRRSGRFATGGDPRSSDGTRPPFTSSAPSCCARTR